MRRTALVRALSLRVQGEMVGARIFVMVQSLVREAARAQGSQGRAHADEVLR
jgi:hypothetical protein